MTRVVVYCLVVVVVMLMLLMIISCTVYNFEDISLFVCLSVCMYVTV